MPDGGTTENKTNIWDKPPHNTPTKYETRGKNFQLSDSHWEGKVLEHMSNMLFFFFFQRATQGSGSNTITLKTLTGPSMLNMSERQLRTTQISMTCCCSTWNVEEFNTTSILGKGGTEKGECSTFYFLRPFPIEIISVLPVKAVMKLTF